MEGGERARHADGRSGGIAADGVRGAHDVAIEGAPHRVVEDGDGGEVAVGRIRCCHRF